MNYALLVVSLITLMISAGCIETRPPEITKCVIINKETAECSSRNDIKDKPTEKMRGYTCLSPKDVGETNAYLLKLLDELDAAARDAIKTLGNQ